MKIQPLPPLNSLVAFEAAARHLSFTAAADELNRTQGAVSRQVRNLEAYLGKSLFSRVRRRIELTPTGVQYFHIVRSSLTSLSGATAELQRWQSDRQVTVATTHAMASMWLLPKISAFRRDHDEVDLRILASDQAQEFSRPEFDLALYYCRTPPSNIRATPLFREEVFPVCSPAYLRSTGDLTRPEQLFDHTLLHLEDAPSDWVQWSEWFHRVGIESAQAPRRRVSINDYPMLIQEALNGQGIALAWGNLVDHYLNNGALVHPVGTVLTSSARFYLLEPEPHVHVKAAVQLFRDWLLAQFQDRGAVQ